MKFAGHSVASIVLGILATGCTSIADVMRPGPAEQPQVQQTYQDLSMPPDLQLHPPGTAAAPPPVEQPVASSTRVASAPATPYGGAASQPAGDIYERNGISKVKPDGTPKTDAELQAELKKIYLAKKTAANPNYGSVFNIGNIFKDE